MQRRRRLLTEDRQAGVEDPLPQRAPRVDLAVPVVLVLDPAHQRLAHRGAPARAQLLELLRRAQLDPTDLAGGGHHEREQGVDGGTELPRDGIDPADAGVAEEAHRATTLRELRGDRRDRDPSREPAPRGQLLAQAQLEHVPLPGEVDQLRAPGVELLGLRGRRLAAPVELGAGLREARAHPLQHRVLRSHDRQLRRAGRDVAQALEGAVQVHVEGAVRLRAPLAEQQTPAEPAQLLQGGAPGRPGRGHAQVHGTLGLMEQDSEHETVHAHGVTRLMNQAREDQLVVDPVRTCDDEFQVPDRGGAVSERHQDPPQQ